MKKNFSPNKAKLKRLQFQRCCNCTFSNKSVFHKTDLSWLLLPLLSNYCSKKLGTSAARSGEKSPFGRFLTLLGDQKFGWATWRPEPKFGRFLTLAKNGLLLGYFWSKNWLLGRLLINQILKKFLKEFQKFPNSFFIFFRKISIFLNHCHTKMQ